MSVNNMLKMIFHHYKKTYLIYSVVFLMIGGLFYIPAIKNIKFDFVYLQTIFVYAFIFCSLFLSAIFGNIIYGEYGKTFTIIQNNKTPLLLTGIIWGIANSLLLTLIFLLFRLNNMENNGFIFISLITIFFTFLGAFFLGAIYSLLLKGKTKINIAILITVLTLISSFKFYYNDCFNIYIILISRGFKDGCLSIIIPLIISSFILGVITYIVYLKSNSKKSTC